MTHVSYSELRGNLARYMDEVCDNRSALHVTRQNARSVVIVSEEEYDTLMETLHLLKSPANASRLLQAIEQADRKPATEHALLEPGGAGPAA